MTKSPFIVLPEFVSPLVCEDIVDLCDFTVPDYDKDGNPLKTTKRCEQAETIIFDRLQQHLLDVEVHYGVTYRGTERLAFEWFPEGSYGPPQAENSNFVSGKWMRTNARDLTAILFLSDYNDSPPFDAEFEVYGGKLEFAQHQFGFNPSRGTLVVFPSDPHFINATAPVLVGDLYQVRIQLTTKTPLMYNPQDYPGNYTCWFT